MNILTKNTPTKNTLTKNTITIDSDMYQENILDHYKNPRHKHTLTKCTFQHHELNPLCGDMLTFYVQIEQSRIKDISFSGHGCAISQASASLLAEYLYNKPIHILQMLTPETIYELLGIDISPGRVKCALLSFVTVTNAFEQYTKSNIKNNINNQNANNLNTNNQTSK